MRLLLAMRKAVCYVVCFSRKFSPEPHASPSRSYLLTVLETLCET